MRASVVALVELAAKTLGARAPVCEIGSRRVEGGGDVDLRQFFPGVSFTGIDIVPGPGVDVVRDVGDLSQFILQDKNPFAHAGTVLCCEVLEHAPDPFALAKGLRRILRSIGWCLITVPFNFPIHSPPDYWRFTPTGLERLLCQAGFSDWVVFWTEPGAQPDTVAALAWKDKAHPPDGLDAFKAGVESWINRWSIPRVPTPGEPFLFCAHPEKALWMPISDVLEYTKPGGIGHVRWIKACQECLTNSKGDTKAIAFAGEGVA